jgi:hypothetical protein
MKTPSLSLLGHLVAMIWHIIGKRGGKNVEAIFE